MATFDYTYKTWDKARPVLLKSTGLGKALKAYEKEKTNVLRGTNPWAECYKDAICALDIVEDVREKAIKACGTTFKDPKKFLESAKPKQEKGELASAFEERMVNCSATSSRS